MDGRLLVTAALHFAVPAGGKWNARHEAYVLLTVEMLKVKPYKSAYSKPI
jgi:hypothetical protein